MIFEVTIDVSALTMFIMALVTILLVSAFYANWGDKMQFASMKQILFMALIIIMPPTLYTVYVFLTQDTETFFGNAFTHIAIDLLLILILGYVEKILFYKTIPFQALPLQ